MKKGIWPRGWRGVRYRVRFYGWAQPRRAFARKWKRMADAIYEWIYP